MDKSKSSRTKKAAKTIIPAADRKAVTQYRGWLIAEGDLHATNGKAYRRLLEARKQSAAEESKKQAAEKIEKKEWEAHKQERASKDLEHGLSAMADVRDLLQMMETGEEGAFCVEANARFARATLADAGVKMEQALIDLRAIKRQPAPYFLPEIDEPEAQEASHV